MLNTFTVISKMYFFHLFTFLQVRQCIISQIYLQHEYMNSDLRPGITRGPTYWSEDGRFVVREKGCPEIQVGVYVCRE